MPKSVYLALLSLGMIVIIIFFQFHHGQNFVNSDKYLQNAIGSFRWVEPRLSFDQENQLCAEKYAVQVAKNCSTKKEHSERKSLVLSIAKLEASLSPHERGLFHLIRDQRQKVSKKLFETALVNVENKSAVWSDLAAAYLLTSDNHDEWQSLESSVIAINQALVIDSHNSRALFNHALVLEKLALNEKAIQAWNDYLHISTSDNQWYIEALTRKKELTTPLFFDEDNDLLGELVNLKEEDLTQLTMQRPSDIWQVFRDDKELLSLIAQDIDAFCEVDHSNWLFLGELLQQQYLDSLLMDTMQWLCSKERLTSEAIEGLQSLASAIGWYNISETNQALNEVIKAYRLLKISESPLAILAQTVHGATLFSKQDYQGASLLLNQNLATISAAYPLLSARHHWYLGSIAIRQTNNEKAVAHFDKGLQLLSSGGDPVQFARLQALKAESLARTGKYRVAWQQGLASLRFARQQQLSQNTISSICYFMSVVAEESSASYLQELFSECSINNLGINSDPSVGVSAYLARAQARIKLEHNKAASQDLATAKEITNKVQDPEERLHALQFVGLFEGLNLITDEPEVSIPILKKSQDYFAERGNYEFQLHSATAIADAYLNMGRKKDVDLQLDVINDLVVYAQESAESFSFSAATHQHHRHFVEQRIKSKLATGDGFEALRALQEARLARQFSKAEFTDYINEVATRKKGKATLVLAWLSGEVAGWLIADTGIIKWFHTFLPSGRTLVARAADTHSVPLAGGRAHALAKLYEELIGPISGLLGEYNELHIVPDDILYGLPFSALWNINSGQYLIEEHQIIISPELLIGDLSSDSKLPFDSIDIFENSASDPARTLITTSEESRKIANLFASSSKVRRFTGKMANSTNFIDSLNHSDIVHYAGHGDVNLSNPLQSKLIFGPNSANNLSAEQLYAFTTRQTPLLVLAACDTAAYTDELPQAMALIRPMLANHAIQVIGSIRPIPDEYYLQMMELFYISFAKSKRPVDALREVQRTLSEGTEPGDVGHWEFLQIYQYL